MTTAMGTIKTFFEAQAPKLASLVPKHLTPDRLIKIALNCIARTPKLQECTSASLLQCVITCAELGLEPGGALGHAYLVPYRVNGTMTCMLVAGYRGFIELAMRAGALKQAEARVVHANDRFDLRFGLQPQLDHVPNLDTPGAPLCVYFVGRFTDGYQHVEVMSWTEVQRTKARSRSKDDGPWVTDEEEMARKTVVRRAMKYMRMSPELERALEEDNQDFVDAQFSRLDVPGIVAPPPQRPIGAATSPALPAAPSGDTAQVATVEAPAPPQVAGVPAASALEPVKVAESDPMEKEIVGLRAAIEAATTKMQLQNLVKRIMALPEKDRTPLRVVYMERSKVLP